MKKILKFLTAFTLIFIFLFPFSKVLAKEDKKWLEDIGITGGTIIPGACLDSAIDCKPDGTTPEGFNKCTTCGLNEIFKTIVNISQLILALTGSAALLMFAYGGTMFIIAAGNQERISKAKEILKAAVIGIIIIFSAWSIVNFTILALTDGEIGTVPKLFGKYWNQG